MQFQYLFTEAQRRRDQYQHPLQVGGEPGQHDFGVGGPKWMSYVLYSTDWRVTIPDLRGSKAPVTLAMIRRWDDWPRQIRVIDDPVEAFRSLADFEAEFEPFEHKVTEMAAAIDGEIQHQIDVARGK